jgi:elongation factor G
MVIARGKQQDTVDSITAGDIGALTKLAEAHTGDTLCDPKRVVFLKKSEFPAPTMRMAIYSKSKGDESKVASSIARIMEEDATVTYEMDTETKQQILSGLGDQHLDVVVSKLKNKFGIELGLEDPSCRLPRDHPQEGQGTGQNKKQSAATASTATFGSSLSRRQRGYGL